MQTLPFNMQVKCTYVQLSCGVVNFGVCLHEQPLPAEMPTCDLEAKVSSSHPSAYSTQLCTPGYYGPVCSLCVRTEQRNSSYGRTGPLNCRLCRHPAIIMLAYIASTLVVLAWLSYIIQITLSDNVAAANGMPDPGRTSQLIRVCHRVHADVRYLASATVAVLGLFRKQIVCKSTQSGVFHSLKSLTHPKFGCIAGFQSVAAVHESVGACEHPHPPHRAGPLHGNQPGLHHRLQRHHVYGLSAHRLSQPCSPRTAHPPGSATAHAACTLCHTAAEVRLSCRCQLIWLGLLDA